MKKTFAILAAVMLFGIGAFAQSGRSIYNKYSEAENVSAVYISPAMFRLIKKLPDMEINSEDINLTAIVKALNGFYLLESEDRGVNENLRGDVEKFVKSGKYELLMEAKEDGETVRIYTCGKGDKISSFVLLAGEKDQCTFICLDGEISRKQLEAIISREGSR